MAPSPSGRVLDLDEIAHARAFAHCGAGAQAGVGADYSTARHMRPFDMGEGADMRTGFNRSTETENNMGLNNGIAPDHGVKGEMHRFGRDQGDARMQSSGARAAA